MCIIGRIGETNLYTGAACGGACIRRIEAEYRLRRHMPPPRNYDEAAERARAATRIREMVRQGIELTPAQMAYL